MPAFVLIGGLTTMVSMTVISWISTGEPPWRSGAYSRFKGALIALSISLIMFGAALFTAFVCLRYELYLADRQDFQELYVEDPFGADEIKKRALLYVSAPLTLLSSTTMVVLAIAFQLLYFSPKILDAIWRSLNFRI